MSYSSKVIINLSDPLRVTDPNGTAVTITALACNVGVSGCNVTISPENWQLREMISRGKNYGQDERFVVAINDDPEIAAAMETIKSKALSVVTERLTQVT